VKKFISIKHILANFYPQIFRTRVKITVWTFGFTEWEVDIERDVFYHFYFISGFPPSRE